MTNAALHTATLLLLLFASTASRLVSSSSSSGADLHAAELFGWMPSRSTCQGTIADCLADEQDVEFDLDSESNRRILATNSYISYGALSRNRVPCSRRGASYYYCQAGAQANPYRRDCSTITRCRS